MTTQIYKEDDDNTTYTTDALIDSLKIELCEFVTEKSEDNKKVENRKYYNQAFCMQRIGAYNPAPYFIFNLGDLSEKLRYELSILDRETRDYVLKQAVGRIFEDINSNIFHKSVSKVLKVRFEQ